MARESCNLDNDEAELIKPSSSSSPPRSVVVLKSSGQDLQLLLQQQKQESLAAESPATASPLLPASSATTPARLSNRCSSCQRRVGLTGFRCRCGDLFCPRHRYSDAHDCSFDYKSSAREQISKANPLLRPAKIIKI